LTCKRRLNGAQIQYTVLTWFSGYGFGTTTAGAPSVYLWPQSRRGREVHWSSPATASAALGRPQTPVSGGTGSGFFVTRQGHVMTNAHVCRRLQDGHGPAAGRVPTPATTIATDKHNDLAVVQTRSRPLRSPPCAATFRRPGEAVVAFGFPFPDWCPPAALSDDRHR
jgi:S1-C subfamily serine protease